MHLYFWYQKLAFEVIERKNTSNQSTLIVLMWLGKGKPIYFEGWPCMF